MQYSPKDCICNPKDRRTRDTHLCSLRKEVLEISGKPSVYSFLPFRGIGALISQNVVDCIRLVTRVCLRIITYRSNGRVADGGLQGHAQTFPCRPNRWEADRLDHGWESSASRLGPVCEGRFLPDLHPEGFDP